MTPQRDFFLWTLFKQLRDWQFVLTPADYNALYQALNAGFGWSSQAALRDLCCALWAKSRREQEIMNTLFDKLALELELTDWHLPTPQAAQQSSKAESSPSKTAETSETAKAAPLSSPPVIKGHKHFPEISFTGVKVSKRAFIFS